MWFLDVPPWKKPTIPPELDLFGLQTPHIFTFLGGFHFFGTILFLFFRFGGHFSLICVVGCWQNTQETRKRHIYRLDLVLSPVFISQVDVPMGAAMGLELGIMDLPQIDHRIGPQFRPMGPGGPELWPNSVVNFVVKSA